MEKKVSEKKAKTCKNGHRYYKTSDCPVCPVCEQERKPKDSFLSSLAAPARRALENHGITSVEELSQFTEKEIKQFHGMGPGSIPKLTNALKEKGLNFKKEG